MAMPGKIPMWDRLHKEDTTSLPKIVHSHLLTFSILHANYVSRAKTVLAAHSKQGNQCSKERRRSATYIYLAADVSLSQGQKAPLKFPTNTFATEGLLTTPRVVGLFPAKQRGSPFSSPRHSARCSLALVSHGRDVTERLTYYFRRRATRRKRRCCLLFSFRWAALHDLCVRERIRYGSPASLWLWSSLCFRARPSLCFFHSGCTFGSHGKCWALVFVLVDFRMM